MTDETEVKVGRTPTPLEDDLYEWARDAIKKEPAYLQESCRHMVTLTSALLAGVLLMLNQISASPAKGVMPIGLAVTGAALMLLALGSALIGNLPRSASINPSYITRVEEARTALVRWKRQHLRWSAIFLALSFAVLIVGLML